MVCVVWTMNGRGSLELIRQFMKMGIEFHQIKVKKNGLKREHVKTLLKYSVDGFDTLISRRTQAWARLKNDFENLKTQEVIDLIAKEPEIMKFPILFDGHEVYLGNDIVEYIADISNKVTEQECNVAQIKEKTND